MNSWTLRPKNRPTQRYRPVLEALEGRLALGGILLSTSTAYSAFEHEGPFSEMPSNRLFLPDEPDDSSPRGKVSDLLTQQSKDDATSRTEFPAQVADRSSISAKHGFADQPIQIAGLMLGQLPVVSPILIIAKQQLSPTCHH